MKIDTAGSGGQLSSASLLDRGAHLSGNFLTRFLHQQQRPVVIHSPGQPAPQVMLQRASPGLPHP